jgi:fucose permease
VSTAAVGVIASAHFVGSAVSPPLAGVILTRLSTRRVVVGSLLLLIVAALLVGLAPSWPLAVGAAVLGGVSQGGLASAINAYLAAAGTRAINFANALFGLASIFSPLLAAWLAPHGLMWPFVAVAGLAALSLLAARVWGVPAMPLVAAQAPARRVGRSMALFVVMLSCYVGLEVGFGAWGGKHMTGLGIGAAALILSLYWGGFTVGRALASAFGARFSPGRLVLGCAALATVTAALGTVPAVAPFTYPVAGLALGPFFGTSMVWAAQLLPVRFVPFLLVSGSVGGIVVPWAIGLGFARSGPIAVPTILTALGAALCVLIVATLRMRRVPVDADARSMA